MSIKKQLGKTYADRLVELEEEMFYLVEVPDSVCFLETCIQEISEKANSIDVVSGCLDSLPI